MISSRLQENLTGHTGSYILPFIWYTGENKELIAGEIQAVYDSGAREFVFENRGGDWFATDFWWDIFKFVLDTAREKGMRVWSLDDSHVNTGSANDSLSKEENAPFRAQNLRMEFMDVSGPLTAGALSLPRRTAEEKIIRITAFSLNEKTGETAGPGLDLTRQIADGLCLIDLPEGLWRIYFILTADPEKCGVFKNYITMVSRASCRHLIDEVHEKFYARFPEYFGNTFAGFFSDEPAFGNCDGQYGPYAYELRPGQPDKMFAWWDDFPEKLARKLNIPEEKVMELLPALWDDMTGVSPRFRLAYMDLITQLWQENFSCQIGTWCREHKVEYIGHNLEDGGAHMRSGWGCGHYFRSMSGQHMAGMDLVFEQLIPGISRIRHAMNNRSSKRESAFYHYTLPKMAASLAHHTPQMKNRALSEVFGATGWTCGAFYMHAIFNTCQVCGVNRFIPHAFSMSLPEVFEKQQEKSAKANSYTPPGYCLKYLPPTFYTGGYNPQFPVFKEIVCCAQRVSHLLSDAQHLPDAAVYYNAEADWMNSPDRQDLDELTMTLTCGGYDYDILPLDILEKAQVQNGQLQVGKETFRVLLVPGSRIIPEKLLALCRRFAASKLPVYVIGRLPEETEAGKADLAGLFSFPVEKILPELYQNCPPGFALADWQPELRFYPARDGNGQNFYLLFNSGIGALALNLKSPGIIYDPWRNRQYRWGGKNPLVFSSQQLLFFYPHGDWGKELPEYPLLPEKWQTFELCYDISLKEAGKNTFRLLRENSRPVNLLKEEKLTRCCGEFRYETTFELPDQSVRFLEIPQAGDAAELILNGESCGFSLGPVCRFEISGKVRCGENTLEIRTFDTPSYIDRKGDAHIGYGAAFPLRPHGFTGDIRLG